MAARKRAGAGCLHCRKNKASRPRGLCYGCYDRPEVRALYPTKDTPLGRCITDYWSGRQKEPTEAELDAMIAEQRKCLPPWWREETERMARGEDDDG